MKHYTKKFTTILLAVTLFSALFVTANASTAKIKSEQFCSGNTFTTMGDVGVKLDTTPLYVHVTIGVAQRYRIRALGCPASNSTNNAVNKTYANGERVDYVSCYKGTKYSVRSMIYEDGYNSAALAVNPLGAGSQVTVEWAPDSTATYTVAEP